MKKWGLVLLILIIASFLRLWMLNGGDVTDDEKHYIIDAQRLLNKDPYIAIRYHPFRHPEPSIGHPFLYQVEQAIIFKLLGLSVYTSRLPNALSGIATVIVLFFLTKQLGGRVRLLAAFFLAILPLTVRFSRNAQLDTAFGLWITIIAVAIWRYLSDAKKIYLLIAGIAVGFAISTKLNGVYTIPMVLLLLLFVKGERFNSKLINKVFFESLWVFIPAGIITILLNDPRAYLDGIIHPSFETYSFFSLEFITQRLPFLFSPNSFVAFIKVNSLLLSPIFLAVGIVSFYFLIFKERSLVKRFLILWSLPLLNLFVIHGLRMDGAYGWVPLIPPLSICVSYWINKELYKKQAKLILMLIVISILPFLFLYGLSFAPIPFKNFPMNHNRTIRQNFYQDIVKKVNEATPKNGRVFFLPQVYYPLYALRTDISWSYYGDLESFDTFVVGSEKIITPVLEKITLAEEVYGFQDDELLRRLIFVKK